MTNENTAKLWELAEEIVKSKVRFWAWKVANMSMDADDLRQEFYICVCTAIEKYGDKPEEEFKPLLGTILNNRAKRLIGYSAAHHEWSFDASYDNHNCGNDSFLDTLADGASVIVESVNQVEEVEAKFDNERSGATPIVTKMVETFNASQAGDKYKKAVTNYLQMPDAEFNLWMEIRDAKIGVYGKDDYPAFFTYGKNICGISSLRMNWLVRSLLECAVNSGALAGTKYDTEEIRTRATEWRAKKQDMSKRRRSNRKAREAAAQI